jgi:hypothetical protein
MLPALQAVSSWGELALPVACCQTTAFDASILIARHAVVLSFGLTLNRRRGTNALFWSSLFRGDFSVTPI